MKEKEERPKPSEPTKKKKGSGIRLFGKILLGILVFFILLILFIRSPWGQEQIKDRLVSYISGKTNTQVHIDKFYLSFSGDLVVKGLYLEDQTGDTLLYSRFLTADIPLIPLLQRKGFAVDHLVWQGVRANISRTDTVSGYNFNFLTEALLPSDTTAVATDTTSAGMSIDIGSFELEDVRLRFKDDPMGVALRLDLGYLDGGFNEFDLENMAFRLDETSLVETRFSFTQKDPAVPSPTSEEPLLPVISVDNLVLKDVVGDYQSQTTGIQTDLDIGDFQLEMPVANLEEQLVRISQIDLRNSEIFINMASTTNQKSPAADTLNKPVFQWPQWDVLIEEMDLIDNDIRITQNSAVPAKGSFNPDALQLQDVVVRAEDIHLSETGLQARVSRLEAEEYSGHRIEKGQFNLELDQRHLQVSDLLLQLDKNRLKGSLSLQYDSFEELLSNPQEVRLQANLQDIEVDLRDLYDFQPELRQNEFFNTLAQKSISGSLDISGTLEELSFRNTRLNWGGTALSGAGSISNITDPDNLAFDFSQVRLQSGKQDLQDFMDLFDLPYDLPEDIDVSGSISGTAQDLTLDVVLNSSLGKVLLDGRIIAVPDIAFNLDLQAIALNVGKILENPALGLASFKAEAAGSMDDGQLLNLEAKGLISTLVYQGYSFEGIELRAQIEDGQGVAKVDYKDDNLNLEIGSSMDLDRVLPQIALKANIIGADLEALGLAQGPVKTAMKVKAEFVGNLEAFDLNAVVEDGVFVYDNESHLMGEVDVIAHVREDTTALLVNNRILNLRLNSNASPTAFVEALDRHYQSYFTDLNNSDSIAAPVNVALRAELIPAPILEEVFFPQLSELDTVNLKVDFDERAKELAAHASIPHAVYYGSEIDSLEFNLISDHENLSFDFGLEQLNAGPLAIKQTLIEGALVDETFYLEFSSDYQDEPLLHIQAMATQEEDILSVSLIPENLILNGKRWDVSEDNEIEIGPDFWRFQNFRLSHNKQVLEATNFVEGIEKDHIGISMDHFNLAALLSYLNPEEVLASGAVNGDFIIEEPFGETGILANLLIEDFGVMDVPLGDLTLEGEAIGADRYQFDLDIDGPADLTLEGSYIANPDAALLDLELVLDQIQMEVVEGFSQGAITATEGSFSGRFDVSGTVAEPIYEGFLQFDDAGLRVAVLDAPYFIPDETLKVTNEGIFMEDFDIEDPEGNNLVLDGAVYTEQLLNPAFDLSFRAEDFTALNSTAEDNDLFYGLGIFDATGSLTGDLMVPEIELDLVVDEDSDLTYVMPPANIELEEREGVVIFVNKENPDRIITQTREEQEGLSLSGILLNSFISVEENATFKVVLDPETGDNFQGSGEGDLLFNIYPNGRTTLAGRIVLNDGHYEMSLYDLVSRKFDIMEGSSIVWAGDPLDADLNITAVYEVETSAAALMASQITAADLDVQSRFNQELDFLVYLRIGGQISEPKISFGLDMPEEEQGSIGGQVYGRVQQINQQESELNKQVFSLLVLNRFFPGGGTDGAGGGTLGFARDNLNDAVSDQLNIFADELLGETGVDLNFGLETYTDYQGVSPEERTQLDVAAEKSLFDDRLIVSVGSEFALQGADQPGESSAILGNVSLEYLLTEDGRFRLEAFRRRSYENVIDGQLIISGLALIFTREFNDFQELWDRILSPADRKKNATNATDEPNK